MGRIQWFYCSFYPVLLFLLPLGLLGKDMNSMIATDRSMNPWSGFTSSYEEESGSQKLDSIPVSELDLSIWKPVASSKWKGDFLLYRSEKLRKLVLNGKYFGKWNRLSATNKSTSERGEELGKIRNISPSEYEEFTKFLIQNHLIQTYWHTESELHLKKKESLGGRWKFYYSGIHRYYTNQSNQGELDFAVEYSPDGIVTLHAN